MPHRQQDRRTFFLVRAMQSPHQRVLIRIDGQERETPLISPLLLAMPPESRQTGQVGAKLRFATLRPSGGVSPAPPKATQQLAERIEERRENVRQNDRGMSLG